METIQEKYKRIRPLIKDGDLVLFHGTKLLAKIIQNCDKSYFNHIGIVLESHKGLFILDSQSNGVECDRLSERISDYKKGNFCVIQSLEDINTDEAMEELFKRQDMKEVFYDYGNGFKELMNRKFGCNFKIGKSDSKDICSDFVYEYALSTNKIVPFQNRVAFPQDYIRHRNDNKTILIGNEGI
jgi:hypothetical protein